MLKDKNSMNISLLLILGIIIICSFNALLFKHISGTMHIVYNLRRLMSISMLMITGLGIVIVPSIRNAVTHTFCSLPRSIRWAFGVLLVWALISAFFGVAPQYAFLEVGNYGLLTLLGLFLGHALREPHAYRVLFTAIFLATLLYIAYQISQYLMIQHALAQGMKAPTKIIRLYIVYTQFINARFFAQVFIWIWPAMIYVSMIAWGKHKILGVFVLFFSAYFISLGLENHSRAIYYSMTLSTIGVTLVFRKSALTWWKWALPTFILALAINYMMFHLMITDSTIAQQNSRLTNTNLNGRQILWSVAWHDFIKPHPFLGSGPMSFASIPNKAFNAHPHNFILKTAAEMGIPAALMSLFIIWTGLWSWLKKSRQLNAQPKAIMLTAALIGSTFDAMVSGNLVMPFAQLLLPVFAGMCLSLALDHTSKNNRKWSAGIVIILTLAFMIMMIQGITPDIFHLQQKIADSLAYLQSCSGKCLLPPLFWFPQHVSPLLLWVR